MAMGRGRRWADTLGVRIECSAANAGHLILKSARWVYAIKFPESISRLAPACFLLSYSSSRFRGVNLPQTNHHGEITSPAILAARARNSKKKFSINAEWTPLPFVSVVLCMGLTCTGFALARKFVADPLAPHAYGSIDQICFILYSNKIHRQNLRWPVILIMTPSFQFVCIYLVPQVLAPHLFPA
jgi:hypothetical protein